MTRDLWTTAASRYQAIREEQAEVIANLRKENRELRAENESLRQELTQTQEAHAYLQRDFEALRQQYAVWAVIHGAGDMAEVKEG
jgi:FtsZ-binding cell division protein ZapB